MSFEIGQNFTGINILKKLNQNGIQFYIRYEGLLSIRVPGNCLKLICDCIISKVKKIPAYHPILNCGWNKYSTHRKNSFLTITFTSQSNEQLLFSFTVKTTLEKMYHKNLSLTKWYKTKISNTSKRVCTIPDIVTRFVFTH